MTNFKEGDCVQLNHGKSPKMNVEKIEGEEVTCTWFVKDNKQTEKFKNSVLKPCNQDDISGDDEGIEPWRDFIKRKNEESNKRTKA